MTKSVHARTTSDNLQEIPGIQILDSTKRLSDCILWEILEGYYSQNGIKAWEHIPSYITSNRIIAEAYADLVVEALVDALPILNLTEPLYILELGCGSGSFTKYFLQELYSKISYFPELQEVKWCHVMTDFTDQCFSTWESDPHLKSFIAQGKLDMGEFRPEEEDSIYLEKAQKILSATTIHNPVVAIANYFFDSIKQDMFMVTEDGTLSEIWVTFFRDLENITEDEALTLCQLRSVDTLNPIDDNHYPDPLLNLILAHYRESLVDTPFIFPIGAFNVIRNLQDMSGQNLILISSDRGFTTLEHLRNRGEIGLKPHGGAFSFPVNFHAIAEYFKGQDGYNFATRYSKFTTTVNILSTHDEIPWNRLRYTFENRINRHNQILNHCHILEMLRNNDQDAQTVLEGCQAVMETFLYEVRTLHACQDKLEAIIPQLNEVQKKQLLEMLNRIEEQIYPVYQEPDPWLALVKLYYALSDYERSKTNLTCSESFFGSTEESKRYQALLSPNSSILYQRE